MQGAEERPSDKEQRSAPLTRSFLLGTDISVPLFSHSSLPSFSLLHQAMASTIMLCWTSLPMWHAACGTFTAAVLCTGISRCDKCNNA